MRPAIFDMRFGFWDLASGLLWRAWRIYGLRGNSVAPSRLGIIGGENPGRRSRTRFAPGYCRSGFQPFEFQAMVSPVSSLWPDMVCLRPISGKNEPDSDCYTLVRTDSGYGEKRAELPRWAPPRTWYGFHLPTPVLQQPATQFRAIQPCSTLRIHRRWIAVRACCFPIGRLPGPLWAAGFWPGKDRQNERNFPNSILSIRLILSKSGLSQFHGFWLLGS
jgi:hypothetical protein